MVAALLVAAATLAATTTGSATPPPGVTDRLSVTTAGVGSPDAPSIAATLSADSRYVAFQSRADLSAHGKPGDNDDWQIYLRDLADGKTSRVGTAGGEAPTISGDGSLVGYTVTDSADAAQLEVVDRNTGDAHQITDTNSDLPDQRSLPCTTAAPATGATDSHCGAQLSTDGTAIAYPARLSPVSPEVAVASSHITTSVAGRAPKTTAPVPVVDFGGPADPRVSLLESVTITGRNGVDPRFRAVAVSGDPGFTMVTSDCSLGTSCSVELAYTGQCAADSPLTVAHGTLTTGSDIPSGETAIPLFAECLGPTTSKARPPVGIGIGVGIQVWGHQAAECRPTIPPGLVAREATSDGADPADREVSHADPVPVGRSSLTAVRVTAGDGGALRFFGPGSCAVQLVQPPKSQQLSGAPAPCVQQAHLNSRQTCIAYLLITPGDVAAYSVSLDAAGVISHVTVTGVRDVVVERRDPSGHGDFGATAPTVVSVDGHGAALNGSQPSISADGRYVAFTAGRSVYLRDITAGDTVTIPPPRASDSLATPSLDGAGDRLAVADTTNGQVYLHDRAAGRTLLVSSAAGLTVPAAGASAGPALSGDGTTMAFSSAAGDLVAGGSGGVNVFLRYIDKTDQLGDTDDVSNAAGPESELDLAAPTVDSTGRRVAFATSAALESTDDNNTYDLYSRETFSRLTSDPTSLDFGTVPVGSSGGPETVTIRNNGVGPATLSTPTGEGGFHITDDGCNGATLHQGQSCTFSVVFTPVGTGPEHSGVTIETSDSDDGPPFIVSVTGTGTVIGTPPPTGSSSTPIRSAGPSPTLSASTSPTSAPSSSPSSTGPPASTVPSPTTTGQNPPALTPGLRLTPPVGTPGGAVFATGTGFPAGVAVLLSWQPGLGSFSVRADNRGRFQLSIPIFPHDRLGERVLVAEFPGGRTALSPTFLVVPAPAQPPGFHGRS